MNSSQTEADPEKFSFKFTWPIFKLKSPELRKNKEENHKRNFLKEITQHQVMKKNSKNPSNKKPFREKKISWLQLGLLKSSLKARNLMSQFQMHSVLETEKRRRTKFQ